MKRQADLQKIEADKAQLEKEKHSETRLAHLLLEQVEQEKNQFAEEQERKEQEAFVKRQADLQKIEADKAQLEKEKQFETSPIHLLLEQVEQEKNQFVEEQKRKEQEAFVKRKADLKKIEVDKTQLEKEKHSETSSIHLLLEQVEREAHNHQVNQNKPLTGNLCPEREHMPITNSLVNADYQCITVADLLENTENEKARVQLQQQREKDLGDQLNEKNTEPEIGAPLDTADDIILLLEKARTKQQDSHVNNEADWMGKEIDNIPLQEPSESDISILLCEVEHVKCRIESKKQEIQKIEHAIETEIENEKTIGEVTIESLLKATHKEQEQMEKLKVGLDVSHTNEVAKPDEQRPGIDELLLHVKKELLAVETKHELVSIERLELKEMCDSKPDIVYLLACAKEEEEKRAYQKAHDKELCDLILADACDRNEDTEDPHTQMEMEALIENTEHEKKRLETQHQIEESFSIKTASLTIPIEKNDPDIEEILCGVQKEILLVKTRNELITPIESVILDVACVNTQEIEQLLICSKQEQEKADRVKQSEILLAIYCENEENVQIENSEEDFEIKITDLIEETGREINKLENSKETSQEVPVLDGECCTETHPSSSISLLWDQINHEKVLEQEKLSTIEELKQFGLVSVDATELNDDGDFDALGVAENVNADEKFYTDVENERCAHQKIIQGESERKEHQAFVESQKMQELHNSNIEKNAENRQKIQIAIDAKLLEVSEIAWQEKQNQIVKENRMKEKEFESDRIMQEKNKIKQGEYDNFFLELETQSLKSKSNIPKLESEITFPGGDIEVVTTQSKDQTCESSNEHGRNFELFSSVETIPWGGVNEQDIRENLLLEQEQRAKSIKVKSELCEFLLSEVENIRTKAEERESINDAVVIKQKEEKTQEENRQINLELQNENAIFASVDELIVRKRIEHAKIKENEQQKQDLALLYSKKNTKESEDVRLWLDEIQKQEQGQYITNELQKSKEELEKYQCSIKTRQNEIKKALDIVQECSENIHPLTLNYDAGINDMKPVVFAKEPCSLVTSTPLEVCARTSAKLSNDLPESEEIAHLQYMLALERDRLANNRQELQKQEIKRLKYQVEITKQEADIVERKLGGVESNVKKQMVDKKERSAKHIKMRQYKEVCSMFT